MSLLRPTVCRTSRIRGEGRNSFRLPPRFLRETQFLTSAPIPKLSIRVMRPQTNGNNCRPCSSSFSNQSRSSSIESVIIRSAQFQQGNRANALLGNNEGHLLQFSAASSGLHSTPACGQMSSISRNQAWRIVGCRLSEGKHGRSKFRGKGDRNASSTLPAVSVKEPQESLADCRLRGWDSKPEAVATICHSGSRTRSGSHRL